MGARDKLMAGALRTGAALSKGLDSAGAAVQSAAADRFGDPSDWLKSALASSSPPEGPVVEPWELTIASIVRGDRDIPWAADKALSMLDRFGGVRIGPQEIGFDDIDIEWDDVVEVRTSSFVEHVSSGAVDREVKRLRSLLPPFPYRERVVRAVAQSLIILSLAALDRTLQEGPAVRPITAGVIHSGRFGRRHEVSLGVTTSILLAGLPAVNEAVVSTAYHHGVPVLDPPDGTGPGAARLRAVRAEIDSLLAHRHRRQTPTEQ